MKSEERKVRSKMAKEAIKKAEQNGGKEQSRNPWRLSVMVFPVVFLAFGFWLLSSLQPYLLETGSLTPFYTTSDFFSGMLHRAAGGVFYVASMLQSCFAVPWVGATLLLLLLCLLAETVRHAFRYHGGGAAWCWLPSLLLLLNYTDAGYMVYLVKMPALAFTPVVGTLCAVLLAWLYRRLSTTAGSKAFVASLLLVILTASAGFWLMGCYALLACLLYFVTDMTAFRQAGRRHATAILVTWASAIALPFALYRLGCFHMRMDALWLAGIPDFLDNEAESHLLTPLRLAMLTILVLAVFTFKNFRLPTAKWRPDLLGGIAVMAAAMWAVSHHTFRDRNFLTILEMKQAIERGDNERVLELSLQSPDTPTRTQVMLTRLALWRTGQADDKLFTYPDGDEPYQAPRVGQYMRLTSGRTIYYYLGKINYAYRWCMEDMVEYGHRPDYLKYMALCSMLNGEPEVAMKYVEQLRHTFFYRDFADHCAQLIAHHRQDEDMKAILPLLQYNDMLDGDGGMVEPYFLESMAYSEGGSRQMVDISLMCNLITKNMRGFWPRFLQLLPTWKGRIPVHYQEAALLFARLQGNADISRLPIDDPVKASFDRLVQASNQNGNSPDNATTLRPEFGGTYWYYYFFVNGLKTN